MVDQQTYDIKLCISKISEAALFTIKIFSYSFFLFIFAINSKKLKALSYRQSFRFNP